MGPRSNPRTSTLGPALLLFVLGGAGAGVIALDYANGFADVSLLLVLNSMPFAVIALGAVMASRRAGRAVLWSPLVVALLVGSVLYAAWYPRYHEMAGAPIIGFFVVGVVALATAIVGAMVIVWTHPPRDPLDQHCARCGYPQFGLPTTRCPECGHDSDPGSGGGE